MKCSNQRVKVNPLLILLGLNVGALVLGITEFFAPISGDTSIYAYYGRQITHGLILYRDLWDFKSPGIYYFFALLFKIFPNSLLTLRISEIVVNLVASYLIYKISIHYFSSGIALTGSAIYLFAANLGGYLNQDGPYPETYVPLLGLIGLYFWLKYTEKQKAKPDLFVAGLCAALLVVLKQISVSFLLGCLFCILCTAPLFDWKKALAILVFAAGGLTAVLPWLIYFRLANVWADFWDAVFVYPRLYAGTTSFSSAVQNCISLISSSMQVYGVLWMLTIAGMVFWGISLKSSQNAFAGNFRILLPWIGFGLLVIAAPGRFYERYLMEILAPVIFLSEFAISRLFSAPIPELRAFGVVLVSLFILAVVVQQLPRSLHMIGHRILSSDPSRSEAMAVDPLFKGSDISVFA